MARSTHYNIVIKFVSDLRPGAVFFRVLRFLHQYKIPPRYNWNIVESGVRHHNPQATQEFIQRKVYFRFFYCPTKKLSMRNNLSAVKEGLQSNSDTVYSRCMVNQLWILKTSNDLLNILIIVLFSLENFIYPNLWLFYAWQYHSSWPKLKTRLSEFIHNTFYIKIKW